MSRKSPDFAKKRKAVESRQLDRPFDPELLDRARAISRHYGFLVQPHDDLGYVARGLEMPYVFADGPTVAACLESLHAALDAAVATMLEQNRTPPSPAGLKRRGEQVNIRFSADEKLLLEEVAHSQGFRGISDFVRSSTLAKLR